MLAVERESKYATSRSSYKAHAYVSLRIVYSESETKDLSTDRRELFDCNGSLSMRANFATHRLQMHIKHSCIHISAERRPFKNKPISLRTTEDIREIEEHDTSAMAQINGTSGGYHHQTAHPQWENMRSVFEYLCASSNNLNRPLQDYVMNKLGGHRYLEEFLDLAASNTIIE